MEQNGITSANYKVYTPGNIQGAEADYFIFKLSHIKASATFASKIRAFTTYITRAKQGTIIVNDAPSNLGFALKLIEDNYLQLIEPLSADVVLSDKKKRIESLTDLLGANIKIEDDFFKFASPNVIDTTIDTIMDAHTVTIEPDEGDVDSKEATYEAAKISGKGLDDNKFMVHSFYNDLNAKIVTNSDGTVSTEINPANNFYGLVAKNITTAELSAAIDKMAAIKYDILGNKKHSDTFTVNGRTIAKNTVGEFVVRTTAMNREYNSPYGKQYGDPKQLLENNVSYANLFYKVKDSTGTTVYIHLATLPKLETVEKAITGGTKSVMHKNYSNFLTGVGKEIVIDPKNFDVHTSTRLVKSGKLENGIWVKDDTKRKEFTLQEIQDIPGLRFFDITTAKFVNKATYFLFPNNEKEFRILYDKFSFDGKIDDVKLHDLFLKYKGKAFSAISFIQKGANIGSAMDSQVKLILLKSKQRALKEIREIIGGSKTEGISIRETILHADPAIKAKGAMLRNSLFNGNQVLDLMINLAVKRGDLFEALIVDSQTRLEGLLTAADTKNDPVLVAFAAEYNKMITTSVTKISKTSILDKISYKSEYLKAVYT
ncbi:MAG: hypothetical protein ACOH2V_01185 [Candidatus Saccharimonadaceae bacterium]